MVEGNLSDPWFVHRRTEYMSAVHMRSLVIFTRRKKVQHSQPYVEPTHILLTLSAFCLGVLLLGGHMGVLGLSLSSLCLIISSDLI